MTLAPQSRWDDSTLCAAAWISTLRPDRATTAGTFEILCVGRLVALKGRSVLIEACAQLRDQGVPARVTLVGDGPARAELEALSGRAGVAEVVNFAGSIGQDGLRACFAAADVFCLPSLAEGLPVVLMEAMAFGVPVISTRIMGIPELVEDEVTGLLVTPGRTDALVTALLRMWRDAGLRTELVRGGRERVRANHDVTESARVLHAVLEHHGIA